jgi:hypothetical protein
MTRQEYKNWRAKETHSLIDVTRQKVGEKGKVGGWIKVY